MDTEEDNQAQVEAPEVSVEPIVAPTVTEVKTPSKKKRSGGQHVVEQVPIDENTAIVPPSPKKRRFNDDNLQYIKDIGVDVPSPKRRQINPQEANAKIRERLKENDKEKKRIISKESPIDKGVNDAVVPKAPIKTPSGDKVIRNEPDFSDLRNLTPEMQAQLALEDEIEAKKQILFNGGTLDDVYSLKGKTENEKSGIEQNNVIETPSQKKRREAAEKAEALKGTQGKPEEIKRYSKEPDSDKYDKKLNSDDATKVKSDGQIDANYGKSLGITQTPNGRDIYKYVGKDGNIYYTNGDNELIDKEGVIQPEKPSETRRRKVAQDKANIPKPDAKPEEVEAEKTSDVPGDDKGREALLGKTKTPDKKRATIIDSIFDVPKYPAKGTLKGETTINGVKVFVYYDGSENGVYYTDEKGNRIDDKGVLQPETPNEKIEREKQQENIAKGKKDGVSGTVDSIIDKAGKIIGKAGEHLDETTRAEQERRNAAKRGAFGVGGHSASSNELSEIGKARLAKLQSRQRKCEENNGIGDNGDTTESVKRKIKELLDGTYRSTDPTCYKSANSGYTYDSHGRIVRKDSVVGGSGSSSKGGSLVGSSSHGGPTFGKKDFSALTTKHSTKDAGGTIMGSGKNAAGTIMGHNRGGKDAAGTIMGHNHGGKDAGGTIMGHGSGKDAAGTIMGHGGGRDAAGTIMGTGRNAAGTIMGFSGAGAVNNAKNATGSIIGGSAVGGSIAGGGAGGFGITTKNATGSIVGASGGNGSIVGGDVNTLAVTKKNATGSIVGGSGDVGSVVSGNGKNLAVTKKNAEGSIMGMMKTGLSVGEIKVPMLDENGEPILEYNEDGTPKEQPVQYVKKQMTFGIKQGNAIGIAPNGKAGHTSRIVRPGVKGTNGNSIGVDATGKAGHPSGILKPKEDGNIGIEGTRPSKLGHIAEELRQGSNAVGIHGGHPSGIMRGYGKKGEVSAVQAGHTSGIMRGTTKKEGNPVGNGGHPSGIMRGTVKKEGSPVTTYEKSGSPITATNGSAVTTGGHPSQIMRGSVGDKKSTDMMDYAETVGRRPSKMMKVASKLAFTQGDQTDLIQGDKTGFIKGDQVGLTQGDKIGLTQGDKIGLTQGDKIGFTRDEKVDLIQGDRIGITKEERLSLTKEERLALAIEERLAFSQGTKGGHPSGIMRTGVPTKKSGNPVATGEKGGHPSGIMRTGAPKRKKGNPVDTGAKGGHPSGIMRTGAPAKKIGNPVAKGENGGHTSRIMRGRVSEKSGHPSKILRQATRFDKNGHPSQMMRQGFSKPVAVTATLAQPASFPNKAIPSTLSMNEATMMTQPRIQRDITIPSVKTVNIAKQNGSMIGNSYTFNIPEARHIPIPIPSPSGSAPPVSRSMIATPSPLTDPRTGEIPEFMKKYRVKAGLSFSSIADVKKQSLFRNGKI